MTLPLLPEVAVGVGLRQPHYREMFERKPALGFLEVHSENFFLDGGASMQALERARATWPISLHGVGLSLGSADELADLHLAKLKRLVDRIEPAIVSEHLCWSGVGGLHFNDLLPLPHTREALALLCTRVDRVQDVLGRRILVENLSAYVEFHASEMTETTFLAEFCPPYRLRYPARHQQSLRQLQVNFGFDPVQRLGELDPSSVGLMRTVGGTTQGVTDDCLIDTHGSPVSDAVWRLHEEACRRLGPKPTLVEWDTDLPGLDVLLGEAAHAQALAARASRAIEGSHD